jgi:hypothetical protein
MRSYITATYEICHSNFTSGCKGKIVPVNVMKLSGGTDPRVLNPGTGRRYLGSFTPRPLSSWGKSIVTRRTRDWEGPEASVEVLERAKTLAVLGIDV